MSETPILWEETVQPGATWSHVLKRGTALRLTDLEGGANAGALFYNFECPVERYNMPDTLKAQHIARLTDGLRAVFRHGPRPVLDHRRHGRLARPDRRLLQRRAGATRSTAKARYQECRNDWHKNALDGFLVELGKWGLGPRDLVPNVNFFSRVTVDDDGGMAFRTGQFAGRRLVELRAEMNVLVILNTCQHPLDPNPKYAPKPVQLSIRRVPRAGARSTLAASRGRRTGAASL